MRVDACKKNLILKICLCSLFCIDLTSVSAEEFVEENLPTMTVTATKEKAKLSETPLSVGVIEDQSIRFTKPTHPQEILGQVPGVAVSVPALSEMPPPPPTTACWSPERIRSGPTATTNSTSATRAAATAWLFPMVAES